MTKWIAPVLVLLAGCGGKSEDGDPRARCTAVVTKGVDATIARRIASGALAKNPDYAKKLTDQVGPKLKESMIGLCVDDKWPEQVLTCFDTAPDVVGCRAGLSEEPRRKFTTTMMQVMAIVNAGRVMPEQLRHPQPAGSATR